MALSQGDVDGAESALVELDSHGTAPSVVTALREKIDEERQRLATEAQKEATLKRIQSMREEIAASGEDHLSDYWIETVSFKVLDTGQED